MKKLLGVVTNNSQHWVGDGFPVRSIFSYNNPTHNVSPFLLMDYAGPAEFPPSSSEHVRGVGSHPHRGFETVTVVYSGEVEHRDSAGGGGKIGPGDVQWMTAASGLVHEEMHGKDFARKGGVFEMIQLWVNLPAKDKKASPRYQEIRDADIPRIELSGGAGSVRVIAGSFAGKKGPTKTFTPVDLWDVRLKAGKAAEFRMPKGHTSLVFVLSGSVTLAGGETLKAAEMGVLSRDEESFSLTATEDAKIMILGGEPINEPVVGYGPFVMNTKQEITQAFEDFQQGRMGQLVK